MPADAVAYYEGLVEKATKTPAWQKYIEENHFEDAFAKSDETRRFLTQYEEQLRGFLKEAGAKVIR